MIATPSNTRAGILPNRGAMSKRKLTKIIQCPPHRIHSFSTAGLAGFFSCDGSFTLIFPVLRQFDGNFVCVDFNSSGEKGPVGNSLANPRASSLNRVARCFSGIARRRSSFRKISRGEN
jgi:hypothetical protein